MPTDWGNYRDYQGPASRFPGSAPAVHVRDARLDLLSDMIPGIFNAKHCLDIGCNAGSVSCQLGFDFNAASVTGVDIDPHLVSQAENLLAIRRSRLRPACSDSEQTVDYFPMSAILKHGYRVEPRGKALHAPQLFEPDCPHVDFVSGDWATANLATSGPYDVILALSVIKWIHLEHLDEGLVTFFEKCASSLKAGGYLIIELQPWDSYQKAIRPHHSPHFKHNLRKLNYRPETSFSGLLKDQGFRLYCTSTALPRRIDVYTKA